MALKNPFGRKGKYRPLEWEDNNALTESEASDLPEALKSSDFESESSFLPKGSTIPPSQILSAALKLGGDELVMQSYKKFQVGDWSWFFSKNPSLAGKRENDFTLKTWDGWDTLNSEKRTVLLDLAGLPKNPTRNTDNINKLVTASEKWRKELYAIFWGDGFDGVWTCNIFVGEAIYWAGKDTSNDEGHYLSASQIHKNSSPFIAVKKGDLVAGNIVTFHNGGHTEIVTKAPIKFVFADDGFCSIGAGRGDIETIGKESCDGSLTFSNDREIDNPNNAYHGVED